MPTKQLFFGNDQRSGDQQLAGASPLAINVITDGAGAVRRRPGLSVWSESGGFTFGSPVIGTHAFENGLIHVLEDRRVLRVGYDPDGLFASLTNLSAGGGSSLLAGTERPVFAATPWRLVIAGGGVPLKVDAGAVVAAPLGGSPPVSNHICALNQRLMSDDQTDADSTGRIRYSYTGDAGTENWDALNFTNAEARPDPLVSLRENGAELFAFGQTSLQVYSPDPTLILTPGRAINRGIAAAHSVISSDEQLAWLTNRREFVTSDGRSINVISDLIANTVDRIDTVSDCYGFRWAADQFDLLCWTMPTDGRTFVAQKGGGWSQWQGWTPGVGHSLFPVTSFYYWEEQNLHIVGTTDGSLHLLDSTAVADATGVLTTEIIKAEVTTGFLNQDTDAVKQCEVVRFTFKRGHATGPTEPQVLLSWRDSLGDFCTPLRLGLGTTGDHLFTIERRGLGTYRSRQWKLEFTDAVDFVLARAEETFSMGGNN